VIHLRVVSPPEVTATLMPMLQSESAVMNLTVLPGAVSHPDGDAVHFDVLHGAANDVIGRLRDLGLERRGSIMLENVDTSLSSVPDRAAARRGRYHEFTPVWAEVEARIALEGILIVGAMVVGPEYGAILSLAFGLTGRFIVALLAGVVGVVSLTEARSATHDRGVHLGDDHPGGLGHLRGAGLRRRQRGPGLGSPVAAQRHGPHGRRGCRHPGAAGHLAARRPPGRGSTARPASGWAMTEASGSRQVVIVLGQPDRL